MLGSEGELGHWDMPTKEADMQQKIRDNLTTLGNVVLMTRASKVLREQYPNSRVRMTKGDIQLIAGKQVRATWVGVGAGALVELKEEGLGGEAEEVMKTARETTLFDGDTPA